MWQKCHGEQLYMGGGREIFIGLTPDNLNKKFWMCKLSVVQPSNKIEQQKLQGELFFVD